MSETKPATDREVAQPASTWLESYLVGESREEQLEEVLADPFPSPRYWGRVQLWWDESWLSFLLTLLATVVLIAVAWLLHVVTPPPIKVGAETVKIETVAVELGMGGEPSRSGGASVASPAESAVQGVVAQQAAERQTIASELSKPTFEVTTQLQTYSSAEAFQHSPERKARMSQILRDLEASGVAIKDLGRGAASGIFKVDAKFKSVVFVIDRSTSMASNQALDRVKAELRYGLDHLSEEQRFAVVFFNEHYELPPAAQMASLKLVAGTSANKQAMQEWIETIYPSGGTFPSPAMSLALQANPELIMLLSDGEFHPSCIQDITQANKKKGAKAAQIDCVGLGEVIVTLKEIADRNGGIYYQAR